MELLERAGLLTSLHAIRTAAEGTLVFVAGEAGIGKSALLREFRRTLPRTTRFQQGFCDALGTPRALGPLHDIARTDMPELGRLLADGADRHVVFTAFLDRLATGGPSVTVIEDAHWADDATLDLLLFLGRRIAGHAAVLIVTYRSEEVGRDHGLRRVLGDLATARSVRRLDVPALSPAAVAALAEPLGRDGAELHAGTGGNPFFVTEALAAPSDEVPGTVRDAVLARAGRLGPAARRVLDLVSIVPDRAELDLLDADATAALDECVQAGMLVREGESVRFRHELARRAVESGVPAGAAVALHRRVLAALEADGSADPARLAHHAEAAGDRAATLRFAPVAGRLAADLGSHREAAAHFARALRHAGAARAADRAELWDRRADSCDRGGDLAESLAASERAIDLWRAEGAVERAALALARRSHVLWKAGRNAEAHETAGAAVATLDPLPASPALAPAYAARARLLMLGRDIPGAIALGSLAIAHAERHGDTGTLGRALNVVGSAHWFSEPDRAVELLTASLAAAGRAGDDLDAGAAMTNLGSGAGEIRRYEPAEHWLTEAIAWCSARDLDASRGYSLAWLARVRFEQGRWADATELATEAVTAHGQHVPSQIVALTVLGRLRTRRGDPDADTPLDRAWELAERTGDLQRLWPVAAARAERAWLAGAPDRIADLVTDTYRLAARLDHGWGIGELGHWLQVAGAAVDAPGAARPWTLQLEGRHADAAAAWRDLGCPYEAALAAAAADDPAGVQELQDLGAWPAAELHARRLRDDGVAGLPRRPRRATRDNPAQLTDRQVEVLELLADGLRNVDIAARLHISAKTVDHHVSAVLGKLGVGTRQEAARWARAPGSGI